MVVLRYPQNQLRMDDYRNDYNSDPSNEVYRTRYHEPTCLEKMCCFYYNCTTPMCIDDCLKVSFFCCDNAGACCQTF